MVTVEQAEGIILSNLYPKRPVAISIENAAGRTLAVSILADRDFPPFNRVAMDGIAILYSEYLKGTREFSIEGVQAAGKPAMRLGSSRNCIEVMTGAVLPAGTDTVIRYEDIDIQNGVAKLGSSVSPNQNIHTQGADASEGQVLLEPGTPISPAEVALFAAVGKEEVEVFAYPETAIISSGDELIGVSEKPELHQIRRSNVYALQSALAEMHWSSTRYHFPDEREVLAQELKAILSKVDVMILSGGVSKGKFDFIPQVLEELGIEKKFHQVGQRPGKPFWFGVSPEGKTVFALPGNPVSTYMCFYRYIRPWIRKSHGLQELPQHVILGGDVKTALPMTYFLQVRVTAENGKLMAYPAAGGGSGDFANLKNVTGFIQLPPSDSGFKAGDVFPYFPFR